VLLFLLVSCDIVIVGVMSFVIVIVVVDVFSRLWVSADSPHCWRSIIGTGSSYGHHYFFDGEIHHSREIQLPDMEN